jgi:hypothetical protein
VIEIVTKLAAGLSKQSKLRLAVVVVVISGLVAIAPKFLEKSAVAPINSSNSGIETNTGASNKGIDNRSGNVTVQGNNATVINNSTIVTK